MDERYDKFRVVVSESYHYFLANRHRLVQPLLLIVLMLSVIIGAGYRSIILKEKFAYEKQALGWILSMASNYRMAPGMYNGEEVKFIQEHPDEYVYTIGKSKFEPKSPMTSEIGWPLILNLILKDGIKGFDNIALFIARYQLMVELFIIIILFWAGKRIAGAAGACFAPFLYSIFKMPMVQMSDVYYYYWTVPFSALSLLFWTVVYRPENDKIKTHWKYLSFFFYGIIVGFASFLRLYFMFLPLFMSPLIFIREKSFKKGLVLLVIIVLGQSVFAVPQILYNKKHFGKYALTTRGHWHLFLQGVGLYPNNPWGIPDSGEINLNKWAIERGGTDMFKDLEASEKWYKKEYFKMVKEHPEFFIEKLFKHLKGGITVSPTNFQFFGVVDEPAGYDLINKFFPWLMLSSFIILFIASRNNFWILAAVSLQGLYLLLVVITWFANYPPFIASYIPVFGLLLAVAIAVHIKLFIAITEGGIRCWVNDSGIKSLPKMVIDCYREDWSVGHGSIEKPAKEIEEQLALNKEEPVIGSAIKEGKNLKFKIAFIVAAVGISSIILIIGIWYIPKNPLSNKNLLSTAEAYAVWTMDDGAGDNIKDTKGTHDAVSVHNIIGEGHFGRARYFNGKDSYIKTPVNFKGWKTFTISLWVKPEKKDNNELSVILDNGHDADSNFVIQNAEINNPNSERWVFRCNGADIFLTIPFNKWTHLVIIADGERGIIQGYLDGVSTGKVMIGKSFEFGDVPLTIGKLAKLDDRYFKGGIDEVVIMDKAIAIR